ncbi:phosphodiesterase [Rhodoferax sp. TBRC 17660]|uniref:Phosphodiesterase n=1 Tax=Rhodoferax potami TaxID=3068338 RepID=A0ABU3KR34_9BURK|nr:phosphodiesterase [Rhodoferax sp. TBRC 17660]MDT7520201.1 phosphodiesterase [Rhodoferax sp. TBRC 17660]
MSSIPLRLVQGSVPKSSGPRPLEAVLQNKSLYPVFQPIVKLDDGSVYAHEALIRGPQGTALHTPDALLRAADEEGLGYAFETACVRATLRSWGRMQTAGRLFVNVSAEALITAYEGRGQQGLLDWIQDFHVTPRMLVLEITEHERVDNMDRLAEVVQEVRAAGLALALDDFGDGRSSLRLWSQIKPEVVKIDKYFTRNISAHGDKLKTIQALQHIATIFGTALVAEGIETAEDLRVLRDVGIEYGQGYFLGRPDAVPLQWLPALPKQVLQERQVAVFPELGRLSQGGHLRSLSLVRAPTVSPETHNDTLARIFLDNSTLHAVAVVEGERPVGIINRAHFMNEYSKLYYREVWGRKPCVVHANMEPRLIEREHSVDELVGILTSQDQRYLSDGFIATDNGRYVGIGTGDQLVRSVTETRIEAARHANPLTFLPGNIPITQHIERLLKKQACFVACYADLNHFKPYNDYYGYWRGDEMIRLLARIAMEQCDAQRDFLGHVGGDDFILLFQSEDWRARCERLVAEFGERARALFDENARQAGGIEAEDRHGVRRFFPCTTLSIGAVVVDGHQFTRAEDVANLAAMAKHDAKLSPTGLHETVLA